MRFLVASQFDAICVVRCRPSFGLIVSQMNYIIKATKKAEAERQIEHTWGKWWGKATTVAAAAAPLLKKSSTREFIPK